MNIKELKKTVRGNGFQESHGSTTMVIDVETVIDLIDEYQAINYTPCCTELPTKKAMNIEIHEQYLDWRKTENGLCRKAFTLGFKQCFYWFKHFKKQN